MSDYGLEFQQWVSVPKFPDNIQDNGEQIKPRLRQYILSGEPCEYTESVRQEFKKLTGGERLKYTAFTILAMFFFVGFLAKLADGGSKSAIEIVSLSIIPLAVVTIIITIFILKIYFGSIALRLADRGEAMCFKYKLYRRLRYELDPEENEYLYYADLGDFCVSISKNTVLDSTVTGIVVNIKGTEHFYLLVEEFQ